MPETSQLSITSDRLVDILRSEIRLATGCTEVAATALAAAKATETLGQPLVRLTIAVSPNIYKNAALAGVPGTPLRGLAAAGALGAVGGRADEGLGLLNAVCPTVLSLAQEILAGGAVTVVCDAQCRETVYIRVDAEAAGAKATAVIQGAHDHIAEIRRDGRQVFRDTGPGNGCDHAEILRTVPVSRLLKLVDVIPAADLDFLVDAVEVNVAAADADLWDGGSRLGPALSRRTEDNHDGLVAARMQAQALGGAAAEARMSGRLVPVMSITGSGNHGIANFLGVYGFAHALGASRERLARALAISSVVTVCVKAHTGKPTAFCGCAIAPATGLAAAAVDLLGGDGETREHAMQSVIGTFAGMLCDGAKESCAFKVTTAVGAAIDLAILAVDGAYVPNRTGVVGATVDETFARLARLNDPGMRETERIVLGFIRDGS